MVCDDKFLILMLIDRLVYPTDILTYENGIEISTRAGEKIISFFEILCVPLQLLLYVNI